MNQKVEKGEVNLVWLLFLLILRAEAPVLGRVALTFRVCLLPLLDLTSLEMSGSWAQKCVSQVTPNPSKLITKMSQDGM